MTDLKDYITFKQACDLLGVSRQRISKSVETKGIPFIQVGSTKLIKRADLDCIKQRGKKYAS